MGGQGNVDDNVLELPGGTYRGVGVRAFNAETRQWSIWWIDSRIATLDPPVRGGFKDGVGDLPGRRHPQRHAHRRPLPAEITATLPLTDGGRPTHRQPGGARLRHRKRVGNFHAMNWSAPSRPTAARSWETNWRDHPRRCSSRARSFASVARGPLPGARVT
jgi:hypothetical protein